MNPAVDSVHTFSEHQWQCGSSGAPHGGGYALVAGVMDKGWLDVFDECQ